MEVLFSKSGGLAGGVHYVGSSPLDALSAPTRAMLDKLLADNPEGYGKFDPGLSDGFEYRILIDKRSTGAIGFQFDDMSAPEGGRELCEALSIEGCEAPMENINQTLSRLERQFEQPGKPNAFNRLLKWIF